MSARCRYCHRLGAGLRVAAGEYAHQACFDAADDADQAAMFATMRLPVPELAAGLALMTERVDREDLTGQRFGRLTVLGPTVRLVAGGWGLRHWRVRCDCGETFEVQTAHLRRGQHGCKRCSDAQAGRARAKRYGGRTVAELAQRAGVTQEAIRLRIRLGWPVSKLAQPARRAA